MTTRTRTAKHAGRHGNEPVRRCALSGQSLPKGDLIRFVLSPDHVVTPDLHCKLPGRGLWLRAERATIEEALKKKLFSRGFRQKALANSDLPDMIYTLSGNDALHTLSLANKAGLVITGYEKIRRALDKGEIGWLLHAREASSNGSEKLDRYFARPHDEHPDDGEQKPVSGVLAALFTGEQLGLALGRSNVIHTGLKRGVMARRFVNALQRTLAFQSPGAGHFSGRPERT